MRYMNLITECTNYAILGHPEFWDTRDLDAKTVERTPSLVCNLNMEDLKQRDGSYEVGTPLLESFDLACSGKSARWKLLRVEIKSGTLFLAFADTQTKKFLNEYHALCPTEVIVFGSNVKELLFNVEVKQADDTTKERYEFEYYGIDTDPSVHSGRQTIALITEQSGYVDRLHSLFRGKDGKYYLEQDVYDS